MKRADFEVIGRTALLTALVVVPLLASVTAAADAEGPALAEQTPTLRADGVTVTATADKAVYAAGDSPVIEVRVASASDEPARVKLALELFKVRPSSPSARMGPLPVRVLNEEHVVELAPGTMKVIRLASKATLLRGETALVVARIGDTTTTLASLAAPESLGDSLGAHLGQPRFELPTIPMAVAIEAPPIAQAQQVAR